MKQCFIYTFILVICFFLASTHQLIAQDEAEGEELENNFAIALILGYTHIPEARVEGETTESENLPTIGLDFFYQISDRWKFGAVIDFELSKYEVDFKGDRLPRETALVTGVVAGFEILPRWGIIFGPGIEFESNKNLFILRLGMEYGFEIGRSWEIFPSVNYDFKQEFSSYSIGLGFGKSF